MTPATPGLVRVTLLPQAAAGEPAALAIRSSRWESAGTGSACLVRTPQLWVRLRRLAVHRACAAWIDRVQLTAGIHHVAAGIVERYTTEYEWAERTGATPADEDRYGPVGVRVLGQADARTAAEQLGAEVPPLVCVPGMDVVLTAWPRYAAHLPRAVDALVLVDVLREDEIRDEEHRSRPR